MIELEKLEERAKNLAHEIDLSAARHNALIGALEEIKAIIIAAKMPPVAPVVEGSQE